MNQNPFSTMATNASMMHGNRDTASKDYAANLQGDGNNAMLDMQTSSMSAIENGYNTMRMSEAEHNYRIIDMARANVPATEPSMNSSMTLQSPHEYDSRPSMSGSSLFSAGHFQSPIMQSPSISPHMVEGASKMNSALNMSQMGPVDMANGMNPMDGHPAMSGVHGMNTQQSAHQSQAAGNVVQSPNQSLIVLKQPNTKRELAAEAEVSETINISTSRKSTSTIEDDEDEKKYPTKTRSSTQLKQDRPVIDHDAVQIETKSDIQKLEEMASYRFLRQNEDDRQAIVARFKEQLNEDDKNLRIKAAIALSFFEKNL